MAIGFGFDSYELPPEPYYVKRFMVFAGAKYYPRPGMYDFVGSFDRLETAEDKVKSLLEGKEREVDWCQIYDFNLNKITMYGNYMGAD